MLFPDVVLFPVLILLVSAAQKCETDIECGHGVLCVDALCIPVGLRRLLSGQQYLSS
ncbi:hypothetical protein B0H16DRAFT_1745315 [Mycena metata]|uniref:Uncharacterized protein n=1 Tax=Mycena metata TaxID=1033252 RepID=A0AAD7H3X0_9AGAR|nr:hypothetical protein B0H16DRAFT_1745315 [Mycena metata]